MKKLTWLLLVVLVVPVLQAKKLKMPVRIVSREGNATEYSYLVSGRAVSECNGKLNGTSTSADINVKCSETDTPSSTYTVKVTGATLSLLLPDSRVVMVSCTSKFDFWSMRPEWNTRRSCRVPPTNDVQAEFDGQNAKLNWSVSLDGKKTQSETYKILSVVKLKPDR